MKKIFLILAVCFFSFGYAQVVDVASIHEVNLPKDTNCDMFTLSPNGEYMLMTSSSYNGLKKFDFSTNQLTTVTEANGAGYNPMILPDGNTIVYRETTLTSGKLRLTSLKSKNLTTGTEQTIVAPTHDLQGASIIGNIVYSVNNGKYSAKSLNLSSKANKQLPILSIKNRQLMITTNGNTKTLSPNGTDASYLWPSVSPNGTKVLYYVGGKGAYVCNLDGSNIQAIGKLRAAKWYNDNIVVGMRDLDNGDFTTESSVIAKNILTNAEQVLTDDSTIAMYPTISLNGDKILFSTPQGKAYIININVK